MGGSMGGDGLLKQSARQRQGDDFKARRGLVLLQRLLTRLKLKYENLSRYSFVKRALAYLLFGFRCIFFLAAFFFLVAVFGVLFFCDAKILSQPCENFSVEPVCTV